MEMRDVVDEFDRVVRVATSEEVRSRHLARRSASFVIRNSQGDFFVQQRSANKRQEPGRWEFPIGGVRAGETYEQAARRELHEECFHGHDLPEIIISERYVYRRDPTKAPGFIGVFFTTYDGEIFPDPGEVSGYRWIEGSAMETFMDECSSLTQMTYRLFVRKEEELLDCVDPDNTVRYQWPIGLAHDNPTIHRTAGVLIFRDETQQEMAIQRRSLNHHTCPGLWAETAGHVAHGESMLDCARKEMQEEMFFGTQMPDLAFTELSTFYKDLDSGKEFRTMFSTIHDGEFSIDPHEVMEWKWVRIDELRKDMIEHPGIYTETFHRVMEEWGKEVKRTTRHNTWA